MFWRFRTVFWTNGLAEHPEYSVESVRLISFPCFPMSYVVASQVKQLVNKLGMMASGDLADAVSSHVESALKQASERAKANGRKTVRPEDL